MARAVLTLFFMPLRPRKMRYLGLFAFIRTNRLLRIEQAKSREISDQNLKQNKSTDVQKSAPRGKTRDVVSNQFGISHDTMEKEMSIVDNKDLLSPEGIPDRVYGFSRVFSIFRIQIISQKEKSPDMGIFADSVRTVIHNIGFGMDAKTLLKP